MSHILEFKNINALISCVYFFWCGKVHLTIDQLKNNLRKAEFEDKRLMHTTKYKKVYIIDTDSSLTNVYIFYYDL